MTNLSKQEIDLESLPDPWEIPVLNLKNNFVNNSVESIVKTDHLFAITEERKILQATNSKISSMQIIIKDWLKSKIQVTQNINDKIREAIALLLWLSKKS